MADYGKPRIKKFSSSALERIKSNRPSVSDGPLDFMSHKPRANTFQNHTPASSNIDAHTPSPFDFQGHVPSPFDFAGHKPVSANIDADTRREQARGQARGPQHPIFGGDKPPGGNMQFAGHKKKDGTFKQFAGHKKKDGTFNFQSSLNVKPSGNYKSSFKF